LSTDELAKIINNDIIIELQREQMAEFDMNILEKNVKKDDLISYGFVKNYDEFIKLCKTQYDITKFINCVNNIGTENIDVRALNNIVGRKRYTKYTKETLDDKFIDEAVNFLICKCGILPTFETVLIAYKKKYHNNILIEKYLSSSGTTDKELIDILNADEKNAKTGVQHLYDDLTEVSECDDDDDDDETCYVFKQNTETIEDEKKYEICDKVGKVFGIRKNELKFSEIRTKIVQYIADNCKARRDEIILDNKITKLLSNKIRKIKVDDIDLLILKILDV
jgi:hypothetical protein